MAPRERGIHALDLRRSIMRVRRRCASSDFAISNRPEVSRSRRCNDPGPALGGALRERGAPFHQDVDQRVVPMAGARVHHQTRRLVQHGEVLVFVRRR